MMPLQSDAKTTIVSASVIMPNEFSVPFNCSVSCEESCQMLAVIV